MRIDVQLILSAGCLQSLSFEGRTRRQQELTAADNTCDWLLNHKTFREWLAAERGLLWIKGIPGSGKSTLLKHTLRTSSKWTTTASKRTFTLSFFFTARGNDLQKTPHGLFRALLHQLLNHDPQSASELVQTYMKRIQTMGEYGKKWSWELGDLQELAANCLRRVVHSTSICLLIDALDECGKDIALDLVKMFESMLSEVAQSWNSIHVCFTCRPYPIGHRYRGLQVEVQNENTRDIETFLMQELRECEYDTSKIVETILLRSKGVFQWASLVVQCMKSRLLEGGTRGKFHSNFL